MHAMHATVAAVQGGAGAASTSGRHAQPPQPGSSSRWRRAGTPPPRLRLAPPRVTNEGKEMRDAKVLADWDLDEAADFITIDPDNPVPNPHLGPLERRVSTTFEEGLFEDEVDAEAMRYWFTEPQSGWNKERRKMKKMREVPNEVDSMLHVEAEAEGRTPLGTLREGQVVRGKLVKLMLNHGMQLDFGAQYDGLVPCWTVDQWERFEGEDLEWYMEIEARIYKLRDPTLYRWPVQLEPLDAALASRLPLPEEHDAPMDLRTIPMPLEELKESTGRDWEANQFQLEMRSQADSRSGKDIFEVRPEQARLSSEEAEELSQCAALFG